MYPELQNIEHSVPRGTVPSVQIDGKAPPFTGMGNAAQPIFGISQ